MVRKLCCCSTNLKAAKILSIFYIIGRVILVGIAAFIVYLVDKSCNIVGPDGTCEITRLIVIIITSALVVSLVIDIGLLVGTIKKIRCLLWSWLVGTGISIIVIISLFITIALNIDDILEEAKDDNGDPLTDDQISAAKTLCSISVVPVIVYSLITVWIMAAVFQATKEIKENKE